MTSAAGVEKDIAEEETAKLIAVEPAESATAPAADSGDDEVGENSAALVGDGKSGVSVGLKPIAEEDNSIAALEKGAEETETDQS